MSAEKIQIASHTASAFDQVVAVALVASALAEVVDDAVRDTLAADCAVYLRSADHAGEKL